MVLFYLSDYVIQQDGDSRDCLFWFCSKAFLLYETMYVTK